MGRAERAGGAGVARPPTGGGEALVGGGALLGGAGIRGGGATRPGEAGDCGHGGCEKNTTTDIRIIATTCLLVTRR